MASLDDDDVAMAGAAVGRHHCPIPSCSAHDSTGHAGWESWAALRAHMDAHQLGALQGAPPVEWLRAKDLTVCPECSRLVSRRCNGGVHRTCMAARLARRPARPLLADGDVGNVDSVLSSLPSLDDIFAAPLATRDFVSARLLPLVEKTFLRCMARVLQHNRPDAWNHVGTAADTIGHRQCRAKQRRNHNLAANCLERWNLGERRALWDEVVAGRRHRGLDSPETRDPEQRQGEAAIQLARRGLPGKAVQRLSGAPPAEPTPAVIAAMKSKFPGRPPHQATSSRPAAPPSNEASVEDVVKAIRSFPRGAAPGPTGLRPDLLEQLVGSGSEERPAVHLLTHLVNLLAETGRPLRGFALTLVALEALPSRSSQRQAMLMCAPCAPVRPYGGLLGRWLLDWGVGWRCPLMMACHAVVQRLLLESLGVVPPLEGSGVQMPVLSPPARLDIAPCFADDGLLAGPSGEVLRCLCHWQGILPQLGLRLSSILDSYSLLVAYIGSRAATLARCQALWPSFQWDNGSGGELDAALQRSCAQLSNSATPVPFPRDDPTQLSQTHSSSLLSKASLAGWCGRAGSDDVCRLHAYPVDGAAAVLGPTPSHTLDTTLSRSDFLAVIGGRLGVDVCGGGPCRFCGKTSDCKGRHALSCMAGGDHVALHNSLRDLVFDYCQRAQVRPVLEAPGLLHGRRRPADVLVRAATTLVARLPDGSQAHSQPSLALDIAAVNALGDNHWDATRQAAGAACLAYAQRKRSHNGTESLCSAAGVRYLPLVWEFQGGCAPETRAFCHRLCGAVAVVEGLDPGAVKSRFSDQVAVLLACAGGRAIRRRQASSGESIGLPLDVAGILALDP
eukprot:s3316_g3.t1